MAANPKLAEVMLAAAKKAGIDESAIIAPKEVPSTQVAAPVAPIVEPPAPVATPVNPPAPVEAPGDAAPSFLFTPPTTPVTPPITPAAPAPVSDKEVNLGNLRKTIQGLEQKLANIYDPEGKVKPDFLKTLDIQNPDIAKLEAERNAALDLVAKHDLKADPRWQAKYVPIENAAVNSILKFADAYEVKADDVKKALSMGPKDRTRFFMENMPDAVSMIAPHLATLDSVAVQKDNDITNSRETLKQIDAQNAVAREQAILQARNAILSTAVRTAAQNGYYVFNTRPGDENWNKGVQQMNETIGQLLTTQDPMAQGQAIALGVAAPVLLSHLKQADAMIKQRDADIQALRTQLALHSGAGASVQVGNGSAPSAGPVDLSTLTPAQLAQKNIRDALARKSQK